MRQFKTWIGLGLLIGVIFITSGCVGQVPTSYIDVSVDTLLSIPANFMDTYVAVNGTLEWLDTDRDDNSFMVFHGDGSYSWHDDVDYDHTYMLHSENTTASLSVVDWNTGHRWHHSGKSTVRGKFYQNKAGEYYLNAHRIIEDEVPN